MCLRRAEQSGAGLVDVCKVMMRLQEYNLPGTSYESGMSLCSEVDNFNRKREKRALECQKHVATSIKQMINAKHGRSAAPPNSSGKRF